MGGGISRKPHILMLGLKGAGKTTMLKNSFWDDATSVDESVGFPVEVFPR